MRPAKPLVDILEKEWDAQLVGTPGKPGLARTLGWSAYHTYRSKGSAAGYPDWTLWRERVVWVETKREQGRLLSGQQEVIRGLLKAGAEVYVVRPHDLEDIGKVLSCSGLPENWPFTPSKHAAVLARGRLLDALAVDLNRPGR